MMRNRVATWFGFGTAPALSKRTVEAVVPVEVVAASAAVQLASDFAASAENIALDLQTKRQKLLDAYAQANDHLLRLMDDVSKVRKIGTALRFRLPPKPWTTLRQLDLAAEMRVEEIQGLLPEINDMIDRDNLEAAEEKLDRANVWSDQATKFVGTFKVLERYLDADHGDKANLAYELAMSVNLALPDDMTADASRELDSAERYYHKAESPYDASAHEKVLEHSLAAIDLMEAWSQKETMRILKVLKKMQKTTDITGWSVKDLAGSKFIALLGLENKLELEARFPRALSAKERSTRESGYRSDGLNCPCCP